MSQRLPVDGFEWIECACFTEDFIKNYNEKYRID